MDRQRWRADGQGQPVRNGCSGRGSLQVECEDDISRLRLAAKLTQVPLS